MQCARLSLWRVWPRSSTCYTSRNSDVSEHKKSMNKSVLAMMHAPSAAFAIDELRELRKLSARSPIAAATSAERSGGLTDKNSPATRSIPTLEAFVARFSDKDPFYAELARERIAQEGGNRCWQRLWKAGPGRRDDELKLKDPNKPD